MNCRPNEMAIVVRSLAGNLGKVVQCLRLATSADLKGAGVWHEGEVWVVDAPMTVLHWGRDPKFVCLAPDSHLAPIHPDGITDEEVRDLYQPAPAKETV